jgi:hypothetical protein
VENLEDPPEQKRWSEADFLLLFSAKNEVSRSQITDFCWQVLEQFRQVPVSSDLEFLRLPEVARAFCPDFFHLELGPSELIIHNLLENSTALANLAHEPLSPLVLGREVDKLILDTLRLKATRLRKLTSESEITFKLTSLNQIVFYTRRLIDDLVSSLSKDCVRSVLKDPRYHQPGSPPANWPPEVKKAVKRFLQLSFQVTLEEEIETRNRMMLQTWAAIGLDSLPINHLLDLIPFSCSHKRTKEALISHFESAFKKPVKELEDFEATNAEFIQTFKMALEIHATTTRKQSEDSSDSFVLLPDLEEFFGQCDFDEIAQSAMAECHQLLPLDTFCRLRNQKSIRAPRPLPKLQKRGGREEDGNSEADGMSSLELAQLLALRAKRKKLEMYLNIG